MGGLALVVSLGTALVGCSEDKPAKQEPSSVGVTRSQGAAIYTKLVAPYNRELEKCNKVLNPLLDAEEASSKDLSHLRSACGEMPEVNRTFADGLSNSKWPAEAAESIGQLVDEVRADQLPWKGVAAAQSPDDLYNPKYPLTENGPAAGLVRAHLGLPAVEE